MDIKNCPVCGAVLVKTSYSVTEYSYACHTKPNNSKLWHYAISFRNEQYIEYINFGKYSAEYFSRNNSTRIFHLEKKYESPIALFSNKIEFSDKWDEMIDNLLLLI